VKCHSWRSESETGAAWKEGLGFAAVGLSSAVSLRRRRRVGEGAMADVIWREWVFAGKAQQLSCVVLIWTS
jgi:hypothetical protein